jgi:bacillolysin
MKKTVTIVKALVFTIAVGVAPLSLLQAQKINGTETEASMKDFPKRTVTSVMGNFNADFSGKNIASDFLAGHLAEWLGAGSDHTFSLVKSSTDDLGIRHSTYQHYYKNVKVADDLILLHEKNGKVIFVNGEFVDTIDLAVSQPLTKAETENKVQLDMKAPDITFADFGQVIVKVKSGREVKLYSASQINALSLKALRSYMYYIDNGSGEIVKKLEKIHHHNIGKVSVSPLVDTSSSSTTYYKGNQQITVDSYNGSYRLKDNTRNIHTMNGTDWDGNGTAINGLTGNITDYTNATPNFTSAAVKAPVEVHWAMKTAYDYYLNVHNRNSYDGSGSIIRNYYNINFNRDAAGAGQSPESGINAAAIDTQGIVAMVYGSGIYQGLSGYFNPFVGIDVAGHEYSHLMVSRTADLAYEGESGALNESFADIFGAAIEFYSNITPNWTIGEGIPNPALGFTFLRSMSNPNSGPAALASQQPDTYQGTYWVDPASTTDDGGVHTNSGVGNYWFYLLSAGGSGTNDIGNAFNVIGITIQKAEKIAYRTLANYLTPNSQFIDAYTASKQAVTDLYGATGNEQQQNVKAWYAVGIGSGLLATHEVKNDVENQFSVYPNPVKNGMFTIENSKNDASFEIYDLSGKLIRSAKKLQKGPNKINISGILKGVYMIKITSGGTTVSKKIIVE